MDYTEQQIRKTLEERLIAFITQYFLIKETISTANITGASLKLNNNLFQSITHCLLHYIQELNDELTDSYSGGTQAVSEVKFRVKGYQYDNSISDSLRQKIHEADSTNNSALAVLVVNELIDSVDYESLNHHILVTQDKLFKKGMQIAADHLFRFFGFAYMRDTPAVWKRGRLHMEERAITYDWSSSYRTMLDNSLLVEPLVSKETGLSYAETLKIIKLNLDYIRYGETLERGCYGKNYDLEVYSYKSKLEYRLSRALVQALAAFIITHGNDKQLEVMTGITFDSESIAA